MNSTPNPAFPAPNTNDTGPPPPAPATAAPGHQARSPQPTPPANLTWWCAPALRPLCAWVRWARGASRHEGHHCLHNFEDLLAHIPYDPDDTAPQAAMLHSAWEPLLRDTVQGLHPPYTPETLRQWLQTNRPQVWAIRVPQAPPASHHQGTGNGEGKGKACNKEARKSARWGEYTKVKRGTGSTRRAMRNSNNTRSTNTKSGKGKGTQCRGSGEGQGQGPRQTTQGGGTRQTSGTTNPAHLVRAGRPATSN